MNLRTACNYLLGAYIAGMLALLGSGCASRDGAAIDHEPQREALKRMQDNQTRRSLQAL